MCFLFYSSSYAQGFEGYYQQADIHKNTVIFVAEGDIWSVPISGGLAQRLTTHPEEETYPSISPDGKTIAFSASYEGPTEIYTMPVQGGIPARRTYESNRSIMNTWTPNGELVYATRAYSKVPDLQLVKIDLESNQKSMIPLSQASEASFNDSGETVFFVRPAYHRNVTKRYQGGTARQIWKYTEGSPEAIKLTTDHPGESHHPMWFENRVYFITDRDGIMNVWSMDETGGDLKQHTTHKEFDVRYANISDGNIVYQIGADLWLYNILSNQSEKIDIRLSTDLDQLQEKWDENPSKYITSVHPDPTGERIVITARGRVFVAPVKSGRFVSFVEKKNVRFRDAAFSNKGDDIFTLSDESGELEFISMPANGLGSETKITNDGSLLRYAGVPSPDDKWIAYDDLESNMYVLNVASGVSTKISTNSEGIRDFAWSPDSKWIAFVQSALNTMSQIHIYNVDTSSSFELTTDRANSVNPRWNPDGKFIYFLSDRSFTSLVGSPWGTRQPEPYFDASEKLYIVSLEKGTRSPFREDDELNKDENKNSDKKKDEKDDDKKKDKIIVKIDQEGIKERIIEVPIKAGNYSNLGVSKKAIYFMSKETGVKAKSHLNVVKIDNKDIILNKKNLPKFRHKKTAFGERLIYQVQ